MAGLRIVVAAVGLACALGLAGCQSNPEPAPLPSVSPSASVSSPAPSSSASVMPPTMPAAARGRGEKSAKAFVRYYFDAINFGITKGDTSALRRLGTSTCKSCRVIASNIQEIYAAGGHIDSRGWELKGVFTVPMQPRRRPVFDLDVFIHPQRVVPKAGAATQNFEGGKQPMTAHLVRVDHRWRVSRLDKVV